MEKNKWEKKVNALEKKVNALEKAGFYFALLTVVLMFGSACLTSIKNQSSELYYSLGFVMGWVAISSSIAMIILLITNRIFFVILLIMRPYYESKMSYEETQEYHHNLLNN